MPYRRLRREDVQRLIIRALQEDIGSGDLTTLTLVPETSRTSARILAKASGVLAGAPVAQWVFHTVSPTIKATIEREDGHAIHTGQTILTVSGPTRAILTAERTVLNVLGQLSGIATLTKSFVDATRPYPVKILDTRKTHPGLRSLEKYAVRCGGGTSHRMGLVDAILIKTNHLKAITRGGAARDTVIAEAVHKVRQTHPGKLVEVEVANPVEFAAALLAKPDVIMLDNWPQNSIHKAVLQRNSAFRRQTKKPLLEVSGGITLATVRQVAKTGVERISIGQLTHSAPSLDVSLHILG